MIDDDGKLAQRWQNKRVNAKKEGIPFELSYHEFKSLVKSAGLVSSQLGFTGQGYVLARYADKGAYRVGNCRFITQRENAAEKKVSKAVIDAAKRNQQRMVKALRLLTKTFPGKYRRIRSAAGIKGAKTRSLQVADSLREKDEKLLSRVKRRFDTSEWGWKSRLARKLGISKRELDCFILRNPKWNPKPRRLKEPVSITANKR